MRKSSHVEQVLNNKGTAIDESADPDTGIEPEASSEPTTREDRIRHAAYAAAEKRGFEPGFETDDWLEAERQIDAQGAPGSPQDPVL